MMKKATLNQALSKSIRIRNVVFENGACRFRNFQHWLLQAEIKTDVHLLLCLFAFDGLRVADYKKAIQSNPMIYEETRVGLGWIDENGRQQRIQLGKISLRLLAATAWKKVQTLPLDTILSYYSYFFNFDMTAEKFTNDQIAWISEIASGPLVEHFIGRIPMTALSDACYARFITKKALIFGSVEEKLDLDSILYNSLEGWLQPQGNDDNPIYIDNIITLCRRGRVDDRQNHKSELLKSCQELLQASTEAGPLTSLILSWVVDLILHGTFAQPDIAISTITNYVGVLTKPLFKALKKQSFEEWDQAKFEASYSLIIVEASPGQRKNMASAINSWHRFLVSWLDVPPIIKKFHDEVPVSIPKANFLWDHEYQFIQKWLSSSTLETRLTLYLKAMFSVAFHIRIRINELLKLRLNDVQIFDQVIQISIRGTKSIAAKRRTDVSLDTCVELVDLLNFRFSEFGLKDDYLFSDPNRLGRVFKLSKLYTSVSHLLKAATGDPTIRFHSLSHTVISTNLRKILVGGSDELLNPFHQFATDVGHFSILTSCSEYFHFYEDAIRQTINRDLSRLKISSELSAKWSGKKSGAIRKKVSRCTEDKNTVYWDVIHSSELIADVRPVTDGYRLSSPIAPKFLSEEHVFGLLTVLNVFADIQKLTAIDQVALRQSLNIEVVKLLLVAAKETFIRCSMNSFINFSSSSEQVIKVLQETNWLSFDKATSEKYQNLLKVVQKNYHLHSKGIIAWLLINNNSYLSLVDPVAASDFIELLSNLDSPVTQLAIAYSKETKPQDLRVLQAIFYKNFNATVPEFMINKRGGRPSIYLLYSSQRVSTNKTPSPATLSIAGLHAILFTMAVFLEVVNEK